MAKEFPEYFRDLKESLKSDNEAVAQLSRRLIRATNWFIVDSNYGNRKDNVSRISEKKPKIWLNILIKCLDTSKTPRSEQAIYFLKKIISENIIGNMESNFIFNFFYNDNNYYGLEVPIVLSAITSIMQYNPTPCRGIGSNPSENHVKCQMWSKIFSDAFSDFNPVWELNHLFSGNSKRDFGRSDFAAIFITESNTPFVFFITEFEVDGFERHKDDIVVLAEGAFELNKIISSRGRFFPEDILEIRLHLALINNTHITFGSIRPELNFEKTLLYYIYDRDLCSYELNTGDKMQDIINVIKLISYLKQVVCEDGYRIKRLITESKTNSHCMGNCYSTNILPKLPKRAERSIQKKTAYTPKKRRVLLHDDFN